MSNNTVKDALRAEVKERFAGFKPGPAELNAMTQVRARTEELANVFITLAPVSRELSSALTCLEEAKYWTNQAIARSGGVA